VPAIAGCSIQHFRLQQQTVSMMIAGGIAGNIYSLKDLKHTEKISKLEDQSDIIN
jgi:hypothetical protein